MVASAVCHSLYSITTHHSKCTELKTPPLTRSSDSFLGFKDQSLRLHLRVRKLRTQKAFAAQTNFFKVIQTAWKVASDGIEAGTNLVPASVPRPMARISVTVAALAVSLFVLKSFLSTAFFVLATMGLVYFTFIALYKDEGARGGGGTTLTKDTPTSTEDALDEARRIMEKYK
ncbi:hypothetical protein TIFTF001_019529 [Ficus carica]|uniref:Transmembrane protein n=1 Tax=Ficus carica TaxID=3494 RepID=A0AA88AT22_FICCA|nr:hypothetical protein TIFTF001_019529 [Ficus carica]